MRYRAVFALFFLFSPGLPAAGADAEMPSGIGPTGSGTGFSVQKNLVVNISSGGSVTNCIGNVSILNEGENTYLPVRINEAVHAGDSIVVGKGASVTVTFDDKTIYAVYPAEKTTKVTFRQKELPRL